MRPTKEPSARIREVTEEPRPPRGWPGGGASGKAPLFWAHQEWEARFSWVVQGTTGRGSGGGDGDLALFRESGPAAPRSRWTRLARDLGFSRIVHARQVHGSRILLHDRASPGLFLGPDADGHLTSRAGILTAVTVADCVPVFLLDSRERGGGVLHAGWRGVVAGILEAGVETMVRTLGSRRKDLFLHLGPAICGECYEVGPEVHEALGLDVPPGPEPVDLRTLLGERALAAGLEAGNITRSGHCTRCGKSPFFSHRRGDLQRQVGFLGFQELTGAAREQAPGAAEVLGPGPGQGV